ncbi:hypothetical protein BGW38_009760, partial [Lunasporangiospora selenospora]
ARSLGYLVVGINEYYTSKRCPKCENFVGRPKDLRRSYCSKCEKYIHRDSMAAHNMEEQMDVKMEHTQSPLKDSPPPEERHSVNDVVWLSKKLMPIMGDLEEQGFGIFQWEIKDWRTLDKRVVGPEFSVGGYKWQVDNERILLFPQGNNAQELVSVYLDSAESRESPDLQWHACAQFALLMSNPNDPTVYTASQAHHRFTPTDADWGFTKFHELRRLETPLDSRDIPLMEKGHTVITAVVRVYDDSTGVLWHDFVNYDSKAMTGYVGLKNQGATCYMNSLLQSLYFTNYFRKAVFEIPTVDDEPSKSVSLALQRVFYQLATSSASVGTTELTKSFGWNSLESFMQHDVQEFNRVLQDNLEGKMKGTHAEGAIQNLFVGKMKSYIKCINVDYESSRVENFYDIQLNVKGCKTLRDSFANYIDVETLDGDNKYHAEGHGLQDARKGVIFESFPPVLHLQLKRFEYDMERDAMVKINDRHEFPLEIDLAEFVSDSDEKKKAGPDDYKYSLHGVLVHSGDLHGGHYFALLKPEKGEGWFRFDDDRVTRAKLKEVLDENYGGGEPLENLGQMSLAMRQLSRHKRFTNAYMLVYIRNNSMDDILKPLTTNDIPEHLHRRIDEERQAMENKRRERDEQLQCLQARLVTDTDFREHDGFDLFDPFSKAGKTLKVRKQDTFASFKKAVADLYEVPMDHIRIWTLLRRQNDTIRTDAPIPDTELNTPMETIRFNYGLRTQVDIKCYVEFADNLSGSPNGKTAPFQSEAQSGNIMIFTKYFDPFTQTLEGVGKLYVQKNGKVGDIVPILNERKGFPANTPLNLLEEIKPTMIEPMKMKSTFSHCEIQSGDIIIFQKELTPKEKTDLQQQNVRYTVASHFNYLFNRIVIEFKPKKEDDPSLETYTLELSRRSTYDQVAATLAEKLNTDPLKIQFFMASAPSGLPKSSIKRATNLLLQEMLPNNAHQSNGLNVLYYEKLEISIVELESKRSFKITWIGPTLKDETIHELHVLKTDTMNAVVDALLKSKLKLSPEGSHKLRIFAAYNGKHVKDVSFQESISSLHEMLTIYVEEIPIEELEQGDDEYVMHCFHFQGDTARTHSIPFRAIIKNGEPFANTKDRIRARLGMNDKEFAKIKFVYYRPNGIVVPLNDGDVVSDTEYIQGDYIGLDHVDKSGRNNRLGFEKAIFIRG